MVLIAPLVSDLVKSVWSAPSISIGVLDPEDPMDVRNDQQQDTHPQVVSSSNFRM